MSGGIDFFPIDNQKWHKISNAIISKQQKLSYGILGSGPSTAMQNNADCSYKDIIE